MAELIAVDDTNCLLNSATRLQMCPTEGLAKCLI
jgi:hypothetical protein